jgi:hypothetical protein
MTLKSARFGHRSDNPVLTDHSRNKKGLPRFSEEQSSNPDARPVGAAGEDSVGTGLSVAEGNCVVERRGGEQPEAKDQSINKTMLNSIRPDALASLRLKGEAENGIRPEKGARKIRDLSLASSSTF